MATGQNVIDIGYDVDKLTAQQKVVVEALTTVFNLAEQIDGRAIAPDIKGLQDFNTAQATAKKGMDDVGLAVQQYNKMLSEMAQNQAKANVASSEMALEAAKAKVIAQEEAKALKEKAVAALGLQDAYQKLSKEYADAAKNAKNLAVEFGESSPMALEAAKSANELGNRLKAIDGSVGQFQRNVGNYTGAMSVLKTELENVRAAISAATAAGVQNSISLNKTADTGGKLSIQTKGAAREFYEIKGATEGSTQAANTNNAALQKLIKQEELLTQVVSRQAQGFTSIQQEVRTTERALATMASEGLQSTEAFKQLQVQLAESKKGIRVFNEEQKMLSSGAPGLAAITAAAKGLSGIYATGAGAAALFAEGNEKVEKELQKLMAVMTLIQGLNELHEAIEKKNGIVTALRATQEKLLTKVYGEKLTAQALNKAATVAEVEATEAATVATGEQVAMTELQAVASTEATAATIALNIALTGGLLLGIGLLIAGVAWLFNTMMDWVNADEIAIKKAGELADANKSITESINAEIAVIKERSQVNIDAKAHELELSKARGESTLTQMALEKQLTEAQKEQADEIIKKFNFTHEGVEKANKAYGAAIVNVKYYRDLLKQTDEKGSGKQKDADIEFYKSKIEEYQKEADAEKATYDQGKEALKQSLDAKNKLEELAATKAKFTADETREYNLKLIEISVADRKRANDKILADEKSTESQRLKAIEDSYEAEKGLNNAQLKDKLKDPSLDSTKRKQIIAESQEKERELLASYLSSREKTIKGFNNRMIEAQKALKNTQLTEDEAANEVIYASDVFSYQERADALKKSSADKQKILENEYKAQKETKAMTDDELKALDADYTAKTKALSIQTDNELITIQLSFFAKMKKDADDFYKDSEKDVELTNAKQTLDSLESFAQQKKALNDKFLAGKIGLTRYNEETKKLNKQAAEDSLKIANELLGNQLKIEEKRLQDSQALIVDYKQKEVDIQKDSKLSEDQKKKAIASLDDKLKTEIGLTKDSEKKILDIKAQYAKNGIKLSDDEAEKIKEGQQKIKESTQELISNSIKLIQSLVDGGYERQLNALQHVKDLTDEMYASEEANIEKSSLNNVNKAALLAQIQAQQRERDKEIAREERDIKNRQARADRDFAVANIIEQTAVGVIAASNPKNIPFPLNIVEATLIGAIGAVQLATVLSKPIPKYAEGTDFHPGGWAMVGEGKFKENVTLPSGQSFMAEKPMLLDLPMGTSVTPITDDDIDTMMYNSMFKKTVNLIGLSASIEKHRNDKTEAILKEQNKLLRKIAEKETSLKLILKSNYNPAFQRDIDIKVFGKKG